ncbi:hypothetical protein [Granulicella rosea]|nr:hypothetical protein [Granulicella rosea]
MWIAAVAHADTIGLDAGKLQDPGAFAVRSAEQLSYLSDIAGTGNLMPASGAVLLPHAGKWRLFVSSLSFADDGKDMRQFSVRLGVRRSSTIFGGHHRTVNHEFCFEDGGVYDLPAGPLLIVVGEKNTRNANIGQIVLTDDIKADATANPDLLLHAAPAQITPLTVTFDEKPSLKPAAVTLKSAPEVEISNDRVKLAFYSSLDGRALVQRVAVRVGKAWKDLPGSDSAESYRVLYRPVDSDPMMQNRGLQHPTWKLDLAPAVTLSAGEGKIRSHLGPSTTPWLSGQLFPLRPIAAHKIDAHTVKLDFASLPIGVMTATWHLEEGDAAAHVGISFDLLKPGYISMGYHGAVVDTVEQTDFMLLPFLWHGHRFPEKPVLTINAMTPTPMALIARQGISYALTADPKDIPFAWPGPLSAPFGFGMRNEDGEAQPFLYSPVMGSPESLHKKAEVATMHFRVLAEEADWKAAYRDIATGIFELTDYREPGDASLSDTAMNLFDLLKTDSANGWSAHGKGPWNIEGRNITTQSSPLTYLSYYLLTGDEDFYRKYALPSLEFLLSHPNVHFGATPGFGEDLWNPKLQLGPLHSYGATVYASAYAMTQGGAPIFGELATKDGKPATTAGGSPTVRLDSNSEGHPAAFGDALQLYVVTGDRKWKDLAMRLGDRYVDERITHRNEKNPGDHPFVNVSFVPDWDGLLRLYEATGERRYLEAAHEGAYWLVSTLWTQPLIPRKNVDLHPVDPKPLLWWRGDRFYRLGMMDEFAPVGGKRPAIPPQHYPEVTAPAWKVSNVGLGLEQPVTYTQTPTDWNILMSVWAPSLLRLAAYTHDDLLKTAARNATIGRFANYPGYYAYTMTDVYQRADFPYKGPDATTIYYHHIPPFSAYVLDYLFSDVEARSGQAILFPSMRQDGYVWFDSNERGFAPGKVYGETAWAWLHRTAAAIDNKNIDKLLAHNDHTLFIVLSNQVNRAQTTKVTFDGSVLGGDPTGRTLRTWVNNQPGKPIAIGKDGASVEAPAQGLVVLALDGAAIHVPTHMTKNAGPLALPTVEANEVQNVSGTDLKAIGTFIAAPPFTSRELYVYVQSTAKQCSGATLTYKIGDEPEQTAVLKEFPCEFSVPVHDMLANVQWKVSHVTPGR